MFNRKKRKAEKELRTRLKKFRYLNAWCDVENLDTRTIINWIDELESLIQELDTLRAHGPNPKGDVIMVIVEGTAATGSIILMGPLTLLGGGILALSVLGLGYSVSELHKKLDAGRMIRIDSEVFVNFMIKLQQEYTIRANADNL